MIVEAHSHPYANLAPVLGDSHRWMVERIATSVGKYIRAFNLFGSVRLLDLGWTSTGKDR